MYQISFTFFDDKNLVIDVEENLLQKFLDSMGSNKVFYTENKETGFWVHAEQVRYFFVRKKALTAAVLPTTQGEVQCQQNQSSEQESVSQS